MFIISKKIAQILCLSSIVLSLCAMEEEGVHQKPAREVLQRKASVDNPVEKKVDPQIEQLAILGSASQEVERKAIVWDLGDVLVGPDKYKIVTQKLKLSNLISYWLLGHKNPFKINRRANEFLNMLGEQQSPDEAKLYSTDGFAVPQLSVDVLTGACTRDEALKRASDLVEVQFQEGHIKSVGEKNALLACMALILDYTKYPETLKVNNKMIELVAECAQSPHCSQYVLQNWQADSFDDFYGSELGKKVFAHIPRDHCMLSCEQGKVKPNTELFTYFLERYNLDPKNTIFIDDVQANVEAARKAGMVAIHFHNLSIVQLKQLLINSGFIEEVPHN